jgi:hypothetical protein
MVMSQVGFPIDFAVILPKNDMIIRMQNLSGAQHTNQTLLN